MGWTLKELPPALRKRIQAATGDLPHVLQVKVDTDDPVVKLYLEIGTVAGAGREIGWSAGKTRRHLVSRGITDFGRRVRGCSNNTTQQVSNTCAKTTWKQGWREVAGRRIYFRSRWEYNYALYLEWLRGKGQLRTWEHEPETFWFEAVRRGVRSYLPDFKVTDNEGRVYFVEVKGWMDPRSKTKLKRMAKYHPEIDLRLVDAKAYGRLAKQVSGYIPEWERDK